MNASNQDRASRTTISTPTATSSGEIIIRFSRRSRRWVSAVGAVTGPHAVVGDACRPVFFRARRGTSDAASHVHPKECHGEDMT
ncbi:hypothetical protein GCM10027199_46860 [Amycolatopsis magusensis]